MRSAIVTLALLLLAACGGGPRAALASAVERRDLAGALAAYDRARESDGGDRELLGRVAALFLELEANDPDEARRSAAVRALASAGAPGRASLDRLADGSGSSQLLAMSALARRGDSSARHYLRGLADSSDPDERAASVLGMDPLEDRALLVERAQAPRRDERQSAIEKLAGAAPDADVGAVLAHAARVDPEAGVRAAAVRSLGSFGAFAVDILRERLSDSATSVRLAAVEALTRADAEAARGILAPLLGMPTSGPGIEAARLLATPASPEGEPDLDALAYLRSALVAPDPTLRAQAGVALVGMRDPRAFQSDLESALAREEDASAKLALARALLRIDASLESGRSALTALLAHGDGMSAVQAAVALAEVGDDDGKRALWAFLDRDDVAVRVVAARAISREGGRPEEARRALEDADPMVRIAAAGGILAASAM